MEIHTLEALGGRSTRNAGSRTRVEMKVNLRKDWIWELFGMSNQQALVLDWMWEVKEEQPQL